MSVIYPRPGNKNTVYVGGFDESIDEEKLNSAFITFGPIKEVFIPRDRTIEGGQRGFGFVEYESPEDAKAAVENMHMAEIFQQIIRCNLARPTRISTAGIHSAPIWELEAAAGADPNPEDGQVNQENSHDDDVDNNV